MSCYNIYNGLDAISEGDWGTGCILIGIGLLGTVDAAVELDAYDSITSGVKDTGYSEPITETVEATDKDGSKTEIYYRTMSQSDYDYLRMTGELVLCIKCFEEKEFNINNT